MALLMLCENYKSKQALCKREFGIRLVMDRHFEGALQNHFLLPRIIHSTEKSRKLRLLNQNEILE